MAVGSRQDARRMSLRVAVGTAAAAATPHTPNKYVACRHTVTTMAITAEATAIASIAAAAQLAPSSVRVPALYSVVR